MSLCTCCICRGATFGYVWSASFDRGTGLDRTYKGIQRLSEIRREARK